MNPITRTAEKLEREALGLFDALKSHSSLYARRGLSEVAWKRYERRTRITDVVRSLERMGA